ncbi:MAG: Gfo/Idh/MocA family oxidoreductase [Candidatus Hydrogenedentes bacterium]|nr:Gfo/Idh/MocA family oxidoreductase [Candidatus Hydrogenedentota bacterium]
MIKPVKVGIVGCGNISEVYFNSGKTFGILDIVACADLVPERAKEKAKKHGIPKAPTVAKLLADRDIEIVINLTIPKAHGEIGLAALEAGKCVHNEKPLAVTRAEGQAMLELADEKRLLVGCAPDTFMGAGIQTCRKLIDDGWIGEPVAANAFMMCHGHESWHPDPDFYYQPGGGPMFDMGPYYLTALVTLIGPIKRVTGSTRATFPERTITSEAKYGTQIKVNTPTHLAGVMDFANGAIGTIVTSFDVWAHNLPCIEIHGTRGSLAVPDPNGFGGVIKIRRAGDPEWREVPHSHGYAKQSRGIGVADMAYALRSGRKHRANGEMAYHVLDVMHAFNDASTSGKHVAIKSRCERPAALPLGLSERELDA